VHDRIDKISRKSREVIDNIGEIIWAINPKNDQLENLVAYLHRFAIQYFDSSPIVCRVEFPESIPAVQLPAESRRNIFLVCKEALHNVLKHSDATEVAVRIQPTQEGLAIVIRDNGKGFSVDCVSSFGNGLVNMKRRMEEIGGECRVESQESSGTTVTLTVNYQESGL
jgi:signal transduction histidine kinase